MAISNDLIERFADIVADGIEDGQDRYDVERYEELEKVSALLKDNDEPVRIQAMIEALAKTGWSLTNDAQDRARYKALIDIAIELGDGREFFGPARAPRTESDDRLDSISSRYVTPKVGINAVVDDGSGRLLMVQRADRGEWCIPGGYADVGLSGSEVAVKEAFEETGLEVEVRSLLGEWDNLSHAGQQIPQYTLMYHCLVTGGSENRHPIETRDMQWFKRSDLPKEIWQEGDPWLEIALRAVEGVKQEPYFDKPRENY